MSNQTAEEFLKNYEEPLIEKVGEEDWKRKKVYDVDEVIAFLNAFAEQRLTTIKEEIEDLEIEEYSNYGRAGASMTQKAVLTLINEELQ